jgi:two-component system, NarL family, invasion response regulator UvrY
MSRIFEEPIVRILIADDHPVVRQGLKQVLASDPEMTVVGEAKNGNEALELARTLEWDVAVLDYSMPDRTGLDVLKVIKREFPERPVLILSMYPEDLHAARMLKAGAAGYLTKESADQELIAAIKKVAGGHKYVSPTLAEKLAFELATDAQKPLHEALSDREYRVMWLLASGKQISEIGELMFLSPSTISTYRTRVLEKLGLTNNADLVRYVIEHRLVE